MGFAVVAFLWIGASQTLRTAELNARAARLRLGELLRPSLYLPPHTPVSEAVRQTAETGAGGIVVIDGQGRSRALVDETRIVQTALRTAGPGPRWPRWHASSNRG